ncbi:MAG: CPBP family intramembrane metalloprotease [Phycisphaerales bacterium]|nr:CPBP family intramembrane metalloprotease [Phycisphaerales bacterium]
MADELRDLNERDGMGGRGASAIRPYPLIAWLIIIALTMTVMLMHMLGSDASSAAEVAEQNVMDRLEGETALGMAQLQGKAAARPTMTKFETGSMAQRLRGVVLKAVIWAPDEGLNELRQIEVQVEESGYEPTESELETMQLLQQLYEHPVPEGRVPLSESQRAELVEQLGWFGQVALAYDSDDAAAKGELLGSAKWLAIVLMVLAIGGIGAFVLGVILLILLIVFACMRKVHHHFGAARSTDGLLAEAFAIWLLCFLGLHLLLEMLAPSMPGMQPHMLGLTGVLHCVTAAVVAWPVIRGAKWNSVRTSIGWTRGAGLWKECGLGICGWFMTLPLLGIGVLIMLLLMVITSGSGQGTGFEPISQPVHPIITAVAEGDVWIMLQVYFVAAMVAPFLEETVFRGLLYRQLRSASRAWSTVGSIAMSALVVSVVFAALHPQGVLAIPALAALATGMTLMREWRGSLLASIVMHALNNGLMITLMLVLFS